MYNDIINLVVLTSMCIVFAFPDVSVWNQFEESSGHWVLSVYIAMLAAAL